MNLLPFNLEEALKDPARVVYRNGEKPLEWHYFESCTTPFPICLTNSQGRLLSYTKDGFLHLNEKNYLDLFLLPLPEKTYWVNVFKVNEEVHLIGPYESEREAFDDVGEYRGFIFLKTISFTI